MTRANEILSHSRDRSPSSSNIISMQCLSPKSSTMHICACRSIRKPLTLEQHIVRRQITNDWLELQQIQKTVQKRPPHDDCALTSNWPESSTNLHVDNRVNLILARNLRVTFKPDFEDTQTPKLFTRNHKGIKRLALKKTPDLQWQPKRLCGNIMENIEESEMDVKADLGSNGTLHRVRRKRDKQKSAYLLAYEFSDSSEEDSCKDYESNKYIFTGYLLSQ